MSENARQVCPVGRLMGKLPCSAGLGQCVSFHCSGRSRPPQHHGKEVNEKYKRSGEHRRGPAGYRPESVKDEPHPRFSIRGRFEVFHTVVGSCKCLRVLSTRRYHVQVVVELVYSRNGQGGYLRELFQVVAGDPTDEPDDASVDDNLHVTQRAVAARVQSTFNAFGQAEEFQALRQCGQGEGLGGGIPLQAVRSIRRNPAGSPSWP